MENQFPNGFISWAETHHEIVSVVTQMITENSMPEILKDIQELHGRTGVQEFCRDLTDEFEKLNEGREWDGEFWDEVDSFVWQKINP